MTKLTMYSATFMYSGTVNWSNMSRGVVMVEMYSGSSHRAVRGVEGADAGAARRFRLPMDCRMKVWACALPLSSISNTAAIANFIMMPCTIVGA